MGERARQRSGAVMAAVAVAGVIVLAACGAGGSAKPGTPYVTPPPTQVPTPPPVAPHGGVNLDVLVVTDGTLRVQALGAQLTTEGVPTTVINLHGSSAPAITRGYLARSLPGGGQGSGSRGSCCPARLPRACPRPRTPALAWYERTFKVRQVDAYTVPAPGLGMEPEACRGPLSGMVSVTSAGASAGFGYLNGSFPFSGGLGQPGHVRLPVRSRAGGRRHAAARRGHPGFGGPGHAGVAGRRGRPPAARGIGFGYASYTTQFQYLAHGIVTWVTRGVNLGDWRNYLDVAYDDMFLGDSQWSMTGHCTPGETACPKGTPMTPSISMTQADIRYAAQWEQQHDFTIEFLYNGGGSVAAEVNGVDPLLQATKPLAQDFYWVNHTYSHAYLGCQQDFKVVPWKCVTSGGQIVWAAGPGLINSQIEGNFTWAAKNGIPAEPATVATGEYSGLLLLPQQPVDNPSLDAAMGPDGIKWVAMDASREPDMRNVGAALGVPRHPIEVGYDVDTVAEEVSELTGPTRPRPTAAAGSARAARSRPASRPWTRPPGGPHTSCPARPGSCSRAAGQ